jgi:hypothetical protein
MIAASWRWYDPIQKNVLPRRIPVTWFDHQSRSKKLAAAAEKALGRGEDVSARDLYARAAQEAEHALAQVSPDKRVTLGAIAMSAASFWRRAHRSDDAARVARLIRGSPELFPMTTGPLDGVTPAARPPGRR